MEEPVSVDSIIQEEQPDVVFIIREGDCVDILSSNSKLKFLVVNYDKLSASTMISDPISIPEGFLTMPKGRYQTR